MMKFKSVLNMKKKIFILLVIFINISYFCFAQTSDNSKAEAVQQAYFIKELSLTTEESTKLWPIYNNYRNEIATAKKDNKDDRIKMEEQVVTIRKKYKNDFKSVLGSDERANKLFVVEKNFNDLLRDELMRRKKQEDQN